MTFVEILNSCIMKKFNVIFVLSLTILFITSTISYAQDKPEEKALEKTNELKKELKLTNDQYDSILGINKIYIKKFEKLRGGNGERPDSAKREKFIKMRQEWNQEIEKILTKEQFEHFLEYQKNQRPPMRPNKN